MGLGIYSGRELRLGDFPQIGKLWLCSEKMGIFFACFVDEGRENYNEERETNGGFNSVRD